MSVIKSNDLGDFQNIEKDVKGVSEAFKELVKSMDSVIEEGKELDKTLSKSIETRKEVNNVTKQTAQNADKLEKSTKKYNTVQVKAAKTESLYFKELKKANKEKEKAAKAADKIAKKEKEHNEALKLTVKSAADAKRQNKALRIERDKLDTTTEAGINQAKEYNKLIDDNTAFINANNDADEERRSGIGKYTEALEGLPDILQGATGGFGNFTNGIKGATKAAIKFIATPIGAIIAAIVVVISAITAAFQKFQPLQDKLNQGMAAFGAVVEVATTTLAKLGKLIISGIVLGFLKMRSGILKARIALNELTGDDEKVAELGKTLEKVNKDIADAEKEVEENANAAADAIKNIGENAIEAGKAAIEIEKLNQAAERLRISNIKNNAELERQIESQQRIADDATKSFTEREAAANKLVKLQSQLNNNILKEAKLKEQAAIADANRLRQERKLTNEELETLNTAIAARINAQKEVEARVLESERLISELKQDRLERDLDFEVDIIDKRLQNQLSFAADETKSIEERKKAIEDFANVYDEAVSRQVGIIEEFTDKKINLDELQNESDISVLTQKVRNLGLSEIIEGRLLEILRDRNDALRDLNDTEKELNKESVESTKEAAEERIKIFTENLDKRAKASATYLNQETTQLNNQLAQGLISEQEYNDKVIELSNNNLNRQIDNLIYLLAFTELTKEEQKTAEEKLAELQLELSEKVKNQYLADNEEKKKSEEELRAFKEQVAIESANTANELFNFNTALNNRQLANLEERLNQGKISEEQYANEVAKINRKQAIADKTAALFNVAINTALAVSKSIAESPTTFGLPFSAFALAQGAIQAAAIAAEPIPQFDKGSKNTPDTYIAGEKRPELRESNGQWSLVTEPTLFTKSAGDKIISGIETQKILSNNLNNKKTDEVITFEKLDKIEKAIKRNKTNVIFDNRGITTIYAQQKLRNTRIDKYIS